MLVTPLVASTFLSDGGSMFGLVPRPLWSKRLPPDDRNRIRQNTNCFLVQLDDGRLGLIDTGCGNPALFSEKEKSISGLAETWHLMEHLARHDVTPEDLSFVVLTHLHWDHAGGCGECLDDGTSRLTFPNAQYFVHIFEWDDARSGDPLLYKSYPQATVQPLLDHQQDHLVLVTDLAPDILPGVRLARSGGHTRGHSVVVLRDKDLVIRHPDAEAIGPVQMVVVAGDVCPTQHHLRMVFQTAYDTYPLQTREWKREALPALAEERSLLMFIHDPDLYGGIIAPDEKEEFRVIKSLPVTR